MEVSDYYICYLDILGYKELMQKRGENQFLQEINQVILETVRIANRKISFPIEILQAEYRIFSDNVLLCYQIPSHEKISDYWYLSSNIFERSYNYILLYLGLLMDQVADLQRLLIKKFNILVRGTITSGTLYFDKNYVYGQGIIDAYRLENNFARFPRIVISSEIQDIFLKYKLEELKCNRIPHLNMIVDNILFIDYLYGVDDDFLNIHHDMIKMGLVQYSKNTRVLEKYEWCKVYHNKFCYQNEKTRFVIE